MIKAVKAQNLNTTRGDIRIKIRCGSDPYVLGPVRRPHLLVKVGKIVALVETWWEVKGVLETLVLGFKC